MASAFDESNIIQIWMDDVVGNSGSLDSYIRFVEDQLINRFASLDTVPGTKESLYHPKTSTGERVIDRKDNRTIVKNTEKSFHPAIAHMIMIFPDKKLKGKDVYFNGTGFLCNFNDKVFLMTAKHNIIGATGGRNELTGRASLFTSLGTRTERANEVRIYFGRNGIKKKPHDCITVSGFSFQIPYNSRDYAVLDLSTQTRKLPKERFDITSLNEDSIKKDLQIAGYPGCRSYGTRTYGAEPYSQWLTPDVKVNLDGHHLKYKEATEGGNSGSPLIYKNKRKGCWSVVGVHISGGEEYNFAEACDDDMIHSINTWLDVKKRTLIKDVVDIPKKGDKDKLSLGKSQSKKPVIASPSSAKETKTVTVKKDVKTPTTIYPRPRQYTIQDESKGKLVTPYLANGGKDKGKPLPQSETKDKLAAARKFFFKDDGVKDSPLNRISSPTTSFRIESSGPNKNFTQVSSTSYSSNAYTTRVVTKSTTTQKYTISSSSSSSIQKS